MPTKTKENRKNLSILIPVQDLKWISLKYNPIVLQHTELLPSDCGISCCYVANVEFKWCYIGLVS
jgi:hypothetical protein